MKRIGSLMVILLITVMLFGCSSSKNHATESTADYDSASSAENGFRGEAQNEQFESEKASDEAHCTPEETRKIIKNANVNLIADVPKDAFDSISNKTKSLGGYIHSYNMNKRDQGDYYYITVKVPAQKLDEFMEYFGTIAEVRNHNTNSQDITKDYYDIQARLNNARKQEDAYIRLLDRAESIEDIMHIRKELDVIQERIESFEGKIRLWDSMVDMSTISIEIQPKAKPITASNDEEWNFMKLADLGRAIRNGFISVTNGIVNILGRIIILLVSLSPVLIIVAAIFIIVRHILKKRAGNNKKDNTPS